MSQASVEHTRVVRQDLADAVRRLNHVLEECDPDPRQRDALVAALRLVGQARDELAPAAVGM